MSGNHLAIYFVVLVLLLPISTAAAGGPDTIKVGNVQLSKNGAGYRKKSLLTLYEGALYLSQPSRNAATIVAADAPMAIRIQIYSSFVSQEKMLSALNEGFQNATGGNTQPIAAQIQEFRNCFGDPIKKGDVFVFSYLPGSGVSVQKNGQQKGVIAGTDFKQALFGIWLSGKPADEGLKRGLLGN